MLTYIWRNLEDVLWNAEDIRENTDMLVKLHGEFGDFFCTATQECGTSCFGLLEGSIAFGISEKY